MDINSLEIEKLVSSLQSRVTDLEDKVMHTKYIETKIYPVGSIYMSIQYIDPKIMFGGTWTQLKDRFLLGVGDTYSSSNATGGEATHKLTVDEMPLHGHSQKVTANSGGGSATRADFSGDAGNYAQYNQGVETYEAGGDQAHNNMPPYRTVYMWKRTA